MPRAYPAEFRQRAVSLVRAGRSVTDITEHRTREGKVYCCAVMDTCSRRIVGWSIDSAQDAQLVVDALDMALQRRRVKHGSIVHADHGVQFTSWAFTDKVRRAGLMPSFGSVGDAFDNAMMESFWSTMQIELLDRKRWTTRIELSNAIFEFIEVFYNRRRRHSGLGYVSPMEFEQALPTQQIARASTATPAAKHGAGQSLHQTQGGSQRLAAQPAGCEPSPWPHQTRQQATAPTSTP